MCSVTDIGDDGEALMTPETCEYRYDTACRKCKSQARVVLRKKDVYCKECFLAMAVHKFRATLGKTKIMKANDKALVAFSGSHSSTALLHFLRSGLDEEQHKKLFFKVVVCYIEEGAIFNKSDRIEHVKNVERQINSFNFPAFITSISEVMSDSTPGSFVVDKEKDIRINNLFQSLKSTTSKEDLLSQLRLRLLTRIAEYFGCNKIFTSEVGSDLAVKLLSSMSLGRGNQLPLQVGFCDFRHKDIKLLRPLRDFTKKEILYYNVFNNLEGSSTPSFATKQSPHGSVQKLTEKFITELQDDFPSTVYTIFRTGDKLSMDESYLDDNEKICLLCKGMINNDKEDFDAVKDMIFSKKISEGKEKKIEGFQPCNEGNDECCGSCGSKERKIEKSEVGKYFCYGCNLILRDLEDVENLPRDILAAVEERRNFDQMKDQISDFLL